MSPSLILALTVAAAPGEPDVRPVVPAARVPAAGAGEKLDALARYGAGRFGVVRGQLPQAAKDLEAAAKADPQAVAPLRDLVDVYVDLGRDAAAIRTAWKVLATDPADADTAHALARLLFDAKRYAEAGDALAGVVDSPRLEKRPTKRLAIHRDLARCREAGGDFTAAAAALRRMAAFLDESKAALHKDGFTLVEIDRQAADAAERLGRALVRGKKHDEAAAAFRTAHKLYADPARANDPASAARLDWNLASALQAKGDAAAALVHLTRHLDRRPAGAEAYLLFAELMRQLGRGGEVVAALRARAEADPRNPAADWVAAVEAARAGFARGQVAEDVLRVAQESTDPAFYRAVVRVYAEANRPAELLNLLDAAFQAARPADDDAKDAEDRSAPGERSRLFAEAVAAEAGFLPALLARGTTDLRAGVPRRPETIELLSWLAERAGQFEQAETLLRFAVRGPAADRVVVPHALLRLLVAQKRWDDVIRECDAGQGRRRRFFFYYLLKAEALAELGRGDEALAAVERVARDARFQSRRQRARVLGILGRYPEMAAECKAALKEFTAADEIQAMRYLLAEAHLGMRQFDRAEAELRKILEDDPDDVTALNNLGYNLADQGRKLAEAEEMIRRAVELDRDERARAGLAQAESAAYLDSLGWVRFRKGELAEARAYLAKASDLPDGASDPTVWDHLGDVCFRLGDRGKAKEAWEKAAGLYENSHLGRQLGRLDEVRRKLKQVE